MRLEPETTEIECELKMGDLVCNPSTGESGEVKGYKWFGKYLHVQVERSDGSGSSYYEPRFLKVIVKAESTNEETKNES